MDIRLIFLNPNMCDVVTEKATGSGYWILVRAQYWPGRQIPQAIQESVMRLNGATLVRKSAMPALEKSC